MNKIPTVYILCHRPKGVLYIGVTSDLRKRVYQHRNHLVRGFSSKYNVCRLVWFSVGDSMEAVIKEEKRLKKWNRDWKIQMIEKSNPSWKDLADELA